MKAKTRIPSVVVQALFALYMYALLKIILFKFRSVDIALLWHRLQQNLGHPGRISGRWRSANLVPLKEISRTLYAPSIHDLINLIGNIAIFMPFGVFLGLLSGGRTSCAAVFLRSFGVSLCLECAEALFAMGSFDVDDLLLNSGGGLIGYLVFKCASTVYGNAASCEPGEKLSGRLASRR